MDSDLDHDRDGGILFAVPATAPVPMVLTDPNRPDDPIVFVKSAFGRMTG